MKMNRADRDYATELFFWIADARGRLVRDYLVNPNTEYLRIWFLKNSLSVEDFKKHLYKHDKASRKYKVYNQIITTLADACADELNTLIQQGAKYMPSLRNGVEILFQGANNAVVEMNKQYGSKLRGFNFDPDTQWQLRM
jgi:hypothetical protein